MKCNVINNIPPTIVSEIFYFSNVNYNLSGSQFPQPSANTIWNGQETISYLVPKIWNMVPEEMKQKLSLFAFKREIKQWIPDNCPCRICINYLPNISFFLTPLVLTIYFLSIVFYFVLVVVVFVLTLECP